LDPWSDPTANVRSNDQDHNSLLRDHKDIDKWSLFGKAYNANSKYPAITLTITVAATSSTVNQSSMEKVANSSLCLDLTSFTTNCAMIAD
jgi:hypothetical protein